MRGPLFALLVSACASAACHSPTEPDLATGRWIGDGACLAVAASECNLVVGCGHGQFPRPVLQSNGTFEIDGTYRIEAGPIGVDPAPPAHFSGTLIGSTLLITVVPTAKGLLPASYTLSPTSAGSCTVPCV